MPDSMQDTLDHIKEVQNGINEFIRHLEQRANNHDQSKLTEPEKSGWDNAADLKTIVYDSPEYHESLKNLQPTLEHHYAHNRHHPQNWDEGINEMSLLDIVEMYYDWKASSKRSKSGSFRKSLEINMKRFHMSDQLWRIFMNTLYDEENGKENHNFFSALTKRFL